MLHLGHTSQFFLAARSFGLHRLHISPYSSSASDKWDSQGVVAMKQLVIAAAVLMVGTVSALAADLPTKSGPLPSVAPVAFNWTGFYLGVGGGFTAGTATGTATAGVNATGTIDYVAVEGGYRYQLPYDLVLGFDVTAPIWASTAKVNPPFGPGFFDSAQPLFIVLPQVQIGYALGRFLPYFGIGVGVADVKAVTTPFGGARFTDTEPDAVLDVSFGLDYALTNNWIIGARYDHLVAEERNYTFATAPTPTIQQVGSNSDGVTGVIKYKF